MVDYNPFAKQLREVNLEDIDKLSEMNVSEGVYMEFKRKMPKNKKIAKVISSFSNTHGGYFIIGVGEEDLTNILSGKIGINLEVNNQPKEKIRNIARDHLNPSPNFDSRLIIREDYENYGILLIKVFESSKAPHIHSSGVICTRTGEGSDPITPETNRWAIEKLYQRNEKWGEKVREFCQPDVVFTKGQLGETDNQFDGWPMIELYGIPSTLGRPICEQVLDDIEGFKSKLKSSEMMSIESEEDASPESVEIGRIYDSYRGSSDAVVAQSYFLDENNNRDPSHTPETFKFFSDGGLKSILSLPILETNEVPDDVWNELDEHLDGNLSYIRFLDGRKVLTNLVLTLNSYIELLKEYGWTDEDSRGLEFKARLKNGNRTMLVFQEPWFREFIDELGPPILYEDSASIPPMGRLQFNLDVKKYGAIIRILIRFLEAFGLPYNRSKEGITELHDELFSYT